MFRILVLFTVVLGLLAACEEGPRVSEDGDILRPFWINESNSAEVQFRHLDAVNAVRQARGLQPVQLSPELNAAAKTHAIDMSRQNRPWDFGSDGSSPLDRVERAGYPGTFIAENISETFEDDMMTLQAWMDDPFARGSILAPKARFLGIAWHQESNGKLWWVQLLGS